MGAGVQKVLVVAKLLLPQEEVGVVGVDLANVSHEFNRNYRALPLRKLEKALCELDKASEYLLWDSLQRNLGVVLPKVHQVLSLFDGLLLLLDVEVD